MLTPFGFTQTVAHLRVPPNTSRDRWPALEPVVQPVVPVNNSAATGFVGTGHGGELIFRLTLSNSADSTEHDLLDVPPDPDNRKWGGGQVAIPAHSCRHVVLSAGMPRTGSTWQQNALRTALGELKRVPAMVGYWDWPKLQHSWARAGVDQCDRK